MKNATSLCVAEKKTAENEMRREKEGKKSM